MNLSMKLIIRFFCFCFILILSSPMLLAGGKKQIEAATFEGEEIWQNDFDVSSRKKGIINYIAYARDRAGNESVAGPYNIKVDPDSGLPVARVVYPEKNAIVRQNINILGTASGRFGVEKVMARIDNGEWFEANGTEYWNLEIDFSEIPDGRRTLFVKALDSKELSGPELAVNFILDTKAPLVELESHKIGDVLSGNVKVKGTISDANDIQSMEISEDNVNFRSLSTKNRKGKYEFSIPVNSNRLPGGPKVYIIRAVDKTGTATTVPLFFYINNSKPALELITPEPDEDVFGTFLLSGRVTTDIGLRSLRYQWGRVSEEIPIRHGDPYWSVVLQMEPRSSKNIKITAEDLGGNKAVVRARLEDKRADKTPFMLTDTPMGNPRVIFLSAVNEGGAVHGNKTIIGTIEHNVQIRNVTYTFDKRTFNEVPFVSRENKTWFTSFCNFAELAATRNGQLLFRITDASGESFDNVPYYVLGEGMPLPTLIVSNPADEELITEPFNISGIAFYEAGIKSIHWRFLGPDMESISLTPAGEKAREAAFAFMTNPNVPFSEAPAEQSFEVPIDFTMITDGEYVMEVYVSDPYGVKSEVESRTIKISTSPPTTEIVSPVITRYNNSAIMMEGFSDDANKIEDVIISMDSGSTWQKVKLEEDGNWELPLNTVLYYDDVQSALVRTIDKYGIMSFSNAMVNIDNTPPELFISSPVNGQVVSSTLRLTGRVSDNIKLKSMTFQIINAANPQIQRTMDLPLKLVIYEDFDLSRFPQGEYFIRVVSTDLADNQSIVSRKINYDAQDMDAEINIFNPMPGDLQSGPVRVVGTVTGSFYPEEVNIMLNGNHIAVTPVSRYGVFTYDVPQEMLAEEARYEFSVNYYSRTRRLITSPGHVIYYNPYGPTLIVDSHNDGDVITGRPWLQGHAYNTQEALEDAQNARNQTVPRAVFISYDNGHSFRPARGTSEWRFRLETSLLPAGPQPVLIRAVFPGGIEAVRRILLYVDTQLPDIVAVSPLEKSTHRDNILIYGSSGDNKDLDNVEVKLRPNNKFWYSVPKFIQGLFFDVNVFGSTYFDVGVGLSFFNDNVRVQGQFGIAPPIAPPSGFVDGGRYTGNVFAIKLMANIFHLPFSSMFGLDWEFFSMNFAVGANFSWFGMDDWREPLFMGAIVAQWDVANFDFKKINPNWKRFRNYAVYLEPQLWFSSSDHEADTIFRMTVGFRFNVF